MKLFQKVSNEALLYRIILAAVVVFFITIGTLIAFQQGSDLYLGNFEEYNNDDVKYIRSAETLLNEGIFTYHKPEDPTVFIMPALTMLLALCMKIFGYWHGITAFRILQVLMMAGTMILLYQICRRFFHERIGVIAIILFALYAPNYMAANLILTESIGQLFLWLFIYTGIVAVDKKKLVWFAIAAICLSIGIYARPNFALLPVVFLIYMLYRGYKIKEIIKPAIVVSGVILICISPWWIRNAVVFDKFIPLTLSSGNPSILGAMIDWRYPAGAEEKFKDDFTRLGKAKTAIESNEIQVELAKKIRNYGFETDRNRYIKHYTVDRVVDMVIVPYYWKPVLHISKPIVGVYHYVVLLLGIIGLLMTIFLKSKRKELSILIITILYFIFTSLPFITFERYGYFLMAFITIYAAYVLHKLYEAVIAKKRNSLKKLERG